MSECDDRSRYIMDGYTLHAIQHVNIQHVKLDTDAEEIYDVIHASFEWCEECSAFTFCRHKFRQLPGQMAELIEE